MILLWLTLIVLSSLPKVQGDLEMEAILEATNKVDGYKQLAATSWRQQTAAGTIVNGKRIYHSYSVSYLFSRHMSPPEWTEGVVRSAKIANLATNLILSRGGVPNSKSFQAKMAPVCAVPKIKCDHLSRFRTLDGSCNNLNFPLWGKALTAQRRFVPPCYGDKFNLGFIPRIKSKVGGPLPNPRFISNIINRQGTSRLQSHIYDVAFTTFGQFVSHDISSVPNSRGYPDIECCKGNKPVDRPECYSFSVPPGEFHTTCMNFVRSEVAPYKHCAPGERNQMNQVTSYIDLSLVYGSTKNDLDTLVDWKTGRLIAGPGNILPEDGPENCMGMAGCLRAGDTRHSAIPDLTVMHILFQREHNRIVKILCKLNPHWNGGRLFYEARKILIGIYQHIVYSEYLPSVLGKHVMRSYGILPTPKGYNTRYDKNIDASIRNSFAVGPLRFGHGQILNDVGCSFMNRKLKLAVRLENEFFKTRTIHDKEYGPDGISRWITTEYGYQPNGIYSDSMRNFLFQTTRGDGFDLAAMDIQRGRDHGIPSYNKFREFCGLKPAMMFKKGIFGFPDHGPEASTLLSKIYKHVEDIDLITGAISEIHVPGGLVGPTFACLIALQFQYSKVGDRFFYENAFQPTGFTPVQLDIIKQQSISTLFCRNFKMGVMQPSGFVSIQRQEAIPCEKFPHLGPNELAAWQEAPVKL